jgi:hypothetical protein
MFDVLRILETAYEKGDFTEFVSLLTEDCVYESMWVLEPLCGREAVSRHLLGKGKSIKESETFPSCWIVELVGNMNPLPESDIVVNGENKRATIALAYEAGKFCLMMSQELNGETNEVLVDLKLTEDGKVSRMDLCMPELFNRNGMCPHVIFLPAKGEEENEDALIRISDGYSSELRVFLGLAEEHFSEYDDLEIPMGNWVKALNFWKSFVEAESYDAFVEHTLGIDYENWSVVDQDVLKRFSWCGASLWKRRKENAVMLEGLLEWTQKYKDSHDCICTYGF